MHPGIIPVEKTRRMQSVTLETERVPEPQVQIKPKKNLKSFIPPLYSVGNNMFRVCYVQPDPLPRCIADLQKLHVEGLEFVKIPINSKDDRLYIKRVIVQFLRSPQIPSDYINRCIEDYNKLQSNENREKLLRMVQFAADYFDFMDLEFLTDPID